MIRLGIDQCGHIAARIFNQPPRCTAFGMNGGGIAASSAATTATRAAGSSGALAFQSR
jgi:hypothetical protein